MTEKLYNSRFLYRILQKPDIAFVSKDDTKDGTDFTIAICQLGWIEPVWLITDGGKFPAEYLFSAGLSDMLPKGDEPLQFYSLFHYKHHYKNPAKRMEAYWRFDIEGTLYKTESQFFEVKDSEL